MPEIIISYMSIKNILKNIIPTPVLIPLQKIHTKYRNYGRLKSEKQLIKAQPELHNRAVDRTRPKKNPINVIFFALMDSVWKYDVLYQLMEKDERFNPIILVCPIVNYGRGNMLKNMNRCYNLFKSRGYKVVRSYDEATDHYVDVRKDLEPDIIFYTNPYKGLIDDRYYITEFRDILTCYTSYFFTNTPEIELTDTLLHNLVWKRYVENEYMLQYSKNHNRNNGENCINLGYPGFDSLVKKGFAVIDPWKIKDKSIKRIIWAPHHTITEYTPVFYSTFLKYYEYMIELAEKYKDKIQICFKPHPLLKNRLELLWGEGKTKKYYQMWNNLENGMVNDGAYEDLFLTSDAIMHDSGSFIGEYLVTGKPSMFLSNDDSFRERYNDIGKECLDHYYIGKQKEDIENFIEEVIEGEDTLYDKRMMFVKNVLLPKNGKLASENIIENLAQELR